MFTVAALYRFCALPDFAELREPLKHACAQHGVKGTLLLAPEGINGTIAGSEPGIRAVLDEMTRLLGGRFEGAEVKFSTASEMPFRRLKVRLKREIVTLGAEGIDPASHAGTEVDARAWNELVSAPDVLVLDVRNDFEVAMGTFEGATNPGLTHFSDFRAFVERALEPQRAKRIAMFCTGGIRCEKASAYLLARGFTDVHQLKGGILKYLEVVPESESRWRGDCFVFDERIALSHGLKESKSAAGEAAEA